jgi:hypothetical protein
MCLVIVGVQSVAINARLGFSRDGHGYGIKSRNIVVKLKSTIHPRSVEMKYSNKRYRYKQNPTAFHADMYPQIPNYSNVMAEWQGRMRHENAHELLLANTAEGVARAHDPVSRSWRGRLMRTRHALHRSPSSRNKCAAEGTMPPRSAQSIAHKGL